MTSKPPKFSQSDQSARFKQAARELGCDESEERFVETVRRIAKAPPQHRAPDSRKAPKRK
jgi:hypothetical protein